MIGRRDAIDGRTPVGPPSDVLAERVCRLEEVFDRIASTRMAGLPLMHPRLVVRAVGFAAAADGLALGALVTPWFMNLVHLPLQAGADRLLPPPGQSEPVALGSWTFDFVGGDEPGLGRFAAASLVSPMSEFADQAAAEATARALLEALRPRPARRGFLFGSARREAGR